MKKIKIDGIEGWYGEEGWYCVENDELLYKCGAFKDKKDINTVIVSDLTELKVWQYNQLVNRLLMHYPDYKIDKLEGKFI